MSSNAIEILIRVIFSNLVTVASIYFRYLICNLLIILPIAQLLSAAGRNSASIMPTQSNLFAVFVTVLFVTTLLPSLRSALNPTFLIISSAILLTAGLVSIVGGRAFGAQLLFAGITFIAALAIKKIKTIRNYSEGSLNDILDARIGER